MKKCQAVHEIPKIIRRSTEESVVPTQEVAATDDFALIEETEKDNDTDIEPIELTESKENKSDQEIDESAGTDSPAEEEEENATTPRLAKVDLRNYLKSKHFIQGVIPEEKNLQTPLELVNIDEQNKEIKDNQLIEISVDQEKESKSEMKNIQFKEPAGAPLIEQKGGNIFIGTKKESQVTAAYSMISSFSMRKKDQIEQQIIENVEIQKKETVEIITTEHKEYEVKSENEENLTSKTVTCKGPKKCESTLLKTKSKTEIRSQIQKEISPSVYREDGMDNVSQKGLVITTACVITSSPSIRKAEEIDQKSKEEIQERIEKDFEQKEDQNVLNAGEGLTTEYFNKDYEVMRQESEKLIGEIEQFPTLGVDTDKLPKYELKSETKSRTINRLNYPEIFLCRKKRKNLERPPPFKEVEVQTDKPSLDEYAPDAVGHCHLYTGKFEDGIRPVDLVLVMSATDNIVVENMKLNFFVGVVKTGIQIECEIGRLYKHKHLQFVKLYATDAVLEAHAAVLGVQRYFRKYHEDLIYNRNLFMKRCCSTLYEKEILQSVRSRYVQPLQYSTLDRAYIVYMILNKQTFGPHRNHCGLQTLLDKKIILDAYPLHDGPYYCRMQQDYSGYNLRQALFLTWAGKRHMFKHQPHHWIHEYFGSKMGFYFVFYGFYNLALFFMALWGSFMMIMYRFKNYWYFGVIRDEFCKFNIRKGPYGDNKKTEDQYKMSVSCPDCFDEGNTICPFTLNYERCMDFYIIDLYDGPYAFFYSVGMAFIAILFVIFWKHTECYWRWIWEEYLPCSDRQLIACKLTLCRWKANLKAAILNIVFPLIAWILLLFVMFILTHYVTAEWLRPLAVKYNKVGGKQHVPLMNRPLDYTIIGLIAIIAMIIFYAFEKIFHIISIMTTKSECHRTFAQFERALILKKFFYTVFFGTTLIVYHAWLKGAFYMSPQEGWNVTFVITTPFSNHTVNLTKFNMYIRNVTFRALTFNCGNTSCMREAFVVLLTLILVRYMILPIAGCIYRAITLYKPKVPPLILPKDKDKKKKKEKKEKKKKPKITRPPVPLPVQNPPQTTCEREYQMYKIKEREITRNFQALFFQFLLIAYFSLLLPPLPWLALIRNVIDMRNKAELYLVYSRRPIFFRTAGIGFWNFIMKLICYGLPIAHAMSFLRMEVIKKFTWFHGNKTSYKNDKYWDRYMFWFNNDMRETKNKWFSKTHFNKTLSAKAIIAEGGVTLAVGKCRFDGFYESVKERHKFKWGEFHNYLTENFTQTAPTGDHYFLKYLKTMVFLVYLHMLALFAVMAWHYLGSCPGEVARYIHRERILCRFHNHRMNYFGNRYRFQPPKDLPVQVGPKSSSSSGSKASIQSKTSKT